MTPISNKNTINSKDVKVDVHYLDPGGGPRQYCGGCQGRQAD